MYVSRRGFVQTASAVRAMPTIIPSHVLGQGAPSKKKVDAAYKNADCKAFQDYCQILSDRSIDAVRSYC